MMALLFVLIGFVVGIIFSVCLIKHYTIGNLRIDNSDTYDGPYMFLEMSSSSGGVEKVGKQKFVVLNVVNENYISQK